MKELRILGFCFERMADGVAEIQDAAEPSFAFVGGNDFGLNPDGVGDDSLDHCWIFREHGWRSLRP